MDLCIYLEGFFFFFWFGLVVSEGERRLGERSEIYQIRFKHYLERYLLDRCAAALVEE